MDDIFSHIKSILLGNRELGADYSIPPVLVGYIVKLYELYGIRRPWDQLLQDLQATGLGWCWESIRLSPKPTQQDIRFLTALTPTATSDFLSDLQERANGGTGEFRTWLLFGVLPEAVDTLVVDMTAFKKALHSFAYGEDSPVCIMISKEGDQVYESITVPQKPQQNVKILIDSWAATIPQPLNSDRLWAELLQITEWLEQRSK